MGVGVGVGDAELNFEEAAKASRSKQVHGSKVRGPTALHCPETGDPLPKPGADVELERIASAQPRSARL